MVALSFMVVQVVTAQGRVGDLNDKIVKLKPEVKAIQVLQEQTAGLQPKLAMVGTTRDDTMYLYTAIENITKSLSSSSGLTNLTTSGDASDGQSADGPTISITGTARSQSDVGMTMLRMNGYPQFEHVTLTSVTQAPPTSSQVSPADAQFEITLQLRSLTPPKSAKTAGGDNVQKS
jgi:Tfp pilus assembly protein PilN